MELANRRDVLKAGLIFKVLPQKHSRARDGFVVCLWMRHVVLKTTELRRSRYCAE